MSISGIKKIIRRLIKKNRHAPFDKNILIGIRSEFTGYLDKSRAPQGKIIIGDDCLISSNISLETNDAILEIGNNTFIGSGTRIQCTGRIQIDSDVLISVDCLIQDSDNHNIDFEIRKNDLSDWKRGYHDWSTHPCKPVKICRGAWIGAKVIILKGVVVGEKAVIGAGSVVTKNVAPNTIVAGNPAMFIKTTN